MSVTRRVRRLVARALEPQSAARSKARFLHWVAKSRVRTRLWYAIRRAYGREQQAMLAGIAAYHDAEAARHSGPLFHLRRDAHRIEKGLSVPPPRRATFAERYIGETISAFEKVVATQAGVPDPTVETTLAWAADVLDQYFDVVEPTPAVTAARRRYDAVAGVVRRDGTRVPQPKDHGLCPVEYDALLAMARRRRSVRAFLAEPVPRDVIDAAVEVARQSPSACNRQAFEFRVYDQPELVEDVVDLAPGFDAHGRKIPAIIAVVGKYRAYFRERDMHVIYVDASLASMALVFAFESLGYASCCINWPSIPSRDRALAEWMSLDPDEEVVMLIAVGRADELVSSPYSEKAPLDVVRSFNRR
jgi:nitroreductase